MRGATVGLTRPLVRADMAVPIRASWAMRSAASCSRRPRLYSPPSSPIVRSPCNTRSGLSRTSWPILPPMPASRSNKPGPASSGNFAISSDPVMLMSLPTSNCGASSMRSPCISAKRRSRSSSFISAGTPPAALMSTAVVAGGVAAPPASADLRISCVASGAGVLPVIEISGLTGKRGAVASSKPKPYTSLNCSIGLTAGVLPAMEISGLSRKREVSTI